MIVHVASFLASVGGSIDSEKYLRPIPGRPGYAAICKKPTYSAKLKKKKAEAATVKHFTDVMKEAKRQYNDPELRAEWQAKHEAAKREASKHPKGYREDVKPQVPYRLWEYITHCIGSKV